MKVQFAALELQAPQHVRRRPFVVRQIVAVGLAAWPSVVERKQRQGKDDCERRPLDIVVLFGTDPSINVDFPIFTGWGGIRGRLRDDKIGDGG